ncbi:MAG TPA: FG-GAP repeat protein, partial [Steroidobacteraceae bacterium]|nr:FG-GAP repeat protein [Steroidobacteraceae bacterium]
EGNRAVIAGSKAIYLFEHRGSQWVQTAKIVLTATDTFFGREIALEHGVIVASSLHQDDDLSESVVHVYQHLRRGVLSRTAVIRPRNGVAGEEFGTGLALDGRLLVVGAPHSQGPGAAYVYVRLGHRWIQIDRLMASDATASDRFGESVGIRAGVIVVGAPGADLGFPPEECCGPLHGNAYVFRLARYGWYESQKLNQQGVEPIYVGVGRDVAMGRGLLALFQNDNHLQIRNVQRALVFDWVDGEFQFGQQVVSVEDGTVPDIDLAGRTLIVSTAVIPDYYVRSSAAILVFGRDAQAPPASAK